MSFRSRHVELILALTAGLALGSHPNFQPLSWLSSIGGLPLQVHAGSDDKTQPAPPPTPAAENTPASKDQEAISAAEGRMFDHHGLATMATSPPSLNSSSALRASSSDRPAYVEEQFLTGLRMPDVPVSRDPKIVEYLQFFTRTETGRAIVNSWLERRDRYRELIRAALAQRSLPSSLEAIAFIESSLYRKAISPAGAGGLWQLMPATARAYGLIVRDGKDERFDPAASTAAAVQHLSDLYRRFNSWELTLAAYNAGTPAIESRLRRHRVSTFWQLAHNEHLPRETALYVPKALAVAIILQNLELFDFVSPESDFPYTLPTTPALSTPPFAPATMYAPAHNSARGGSGKQNMEYDLSADEAAAGPSYALLIDRHTGKMHSISNSGQPEEIGDTFAARSPQMALQKARPKSPLTVYEVKRGDALEAIARHHDVSVSELVDWNGIRDPGLLRTGLKLRIYATKQSEPTNSPPRAASAPTESKIRKKISTSERASVPHTEL